MLRLGLGVLQDYNKLKADTQSKNIAAWTPVVAEILDGLSRLDDKAVSVHHRNIIVPLYSSHSQFARYMPAIYPLATELLARELAPDVRVALRTYLIRVGLAQGIIDNASV